MMKVGVFRGERGKMKLKIVRTGRSGRRRVEVVDGRGRQGRKVAASVDCGAVPRASRKKGARPDVQGSVAESLGAARVWQ